MLAARMWLCLDRLEAFLILFDGHAIAYRDGVGAAYSLQAEFAFYLAWYGCAVFSAYFIPASRVFDDDSFQLL